MRTYLVSLTVVTVLAPIGCNKAAVLTAPTPVTPVPVTSSPATPAMIHVTGIATDDNGSPVSGAIVTVHPDPDGTSVSGVTDATGSYSLDFQSVGRTTAVEVGYVNAESPDREPFFDYLFLSADGKSASKNLHLYRIKRISAGESTRVTVVPGDTNCGYADELTCRTVRIEVPTDGVLSLGCANPALKIMEPVNYWPHKVTAGTEVIIPIGMWFESTVSQSCQLDTSLAK